MANAIKYNLSAETLALKKGNFWIGTGDVGKGPTSSTGFYNGLEPPAGGFTIYLNKASGGPSIYTVSNESQLTALTNSISVSTNLIKNNNGGNFANGTLAPFNGSYGTLPTVVDISNDRPYNGSISTKAAKFVAGGGMSIYSDPSPFTMTAGVTYTFSFWYKLANSNQTDIYFQNQGGSGDMNGNFLASSSNYFAKPTQTWQRCSWTFTNVVNKIYFIIALTNSSAGSELLTTEFTLTEGSTPGGPGLTTSGACLNWFATQNDKMILNKDYEPIITNGLVLCLDANFTPSYPTIGTTVYNLGTSSNATLINGCNWVNSGTTSYFNLDGTDDYMLLSSDVLFGSSRTFTLQIFGMFEPSPAFAGPLRISGTLFFYFPGSATSGYSQGAYRLAYPYPSVNYMFMNVPVNQYFSLTLTNLDTQTPSVQGLSVNNSTLATSNYTGRIEPYEIRIGFADAPIKGKILKVLAYNRVLSQSEIAQNTFTYPMNLNGLVLGVDASNPLSYQQGSTTWYDLSGNQNNFTLNNGVGYSNNLLTFDGVDDYAKITGITGYGSTTTLTVIIVCKWGSGNGMLFGVSSNYDVGYTHALGFNTAQGNVYAKSYYPPANTLVHYTFVMRSSGYGANAVTNNLIYVNGILQTDAYYGSPGNNTTNTFGSNFQISSWPDRGDTYYQNCSVGACFIYNRELTSGEVVQNYSQMQTKFNL